MKSPAYDLRVAVAIVLSGIIYEGSEVPVFDQATDDNSSFPRIILQGVTGGGARWSKCGFGDDWSQMIKVSMAFLNDVTQNPIDQISDIILERLVPFTRPFLIIGPSWNVWDVKGSISGSPQIYSDQTRKYIDSNIRITYSIKELNP